MPAFTRCSLKDRRRRSRISAFTLIESLVTVGILAALVALLLPTIVSAREHVRLTICASNLHRIDSALLAYAAGNGGKFPPNIGSPGRYWFDPARAGQFLGDLRTPSGKPGGGVLACPSDDNALRSYSMNIWASSVIDPLSPGETPRGKIWPPLPPNASRLILVCERWSSTGSDAIGWSSPATLGSPGVTAGQRFGAAGGFAPLMYAGRWEMINCELPYMRHRRRDDSGIETQPFGRIQIGYADGHVALKSNRDLADETTGVSTGDSCWFPGETR